MIRLFVAALIACTIAHAPARAGDIVETAIAKGIFTTLVAAFGAANIADDLREPGPFTLFAPTDTAFAALPPGMLERLMKPANRQQLTDLLSRHLLAGRVMIADMTGSDHAAGTFGGGQVIIDGRGAVPMVDGVPIRLGDIVAENGVIHVVDRVLLP